MMNFISDVDPDPDPVGSGFIQRHKITDKMKGKAEFNQQKSLFSQEIICFNSEPLKK